MNDKKNYKHEAIPPNNEEEFNKQREMLKYYRDYVTIFERVN